MEELYDRLAEAGVASVTIDYNGSGDEGWVEDAIYDAALPPSDDTLDKAVADAAYDVLERKFAGWEINEGSEGTITIDVENRRTSIHHGHHIESTEYEDVEV